MLFHQYIPHPILQLSRTQQESWQHCPMTPINILLGGRERVQQSITSKNILFVSWFSNTSFIHYNFTATSCSHVTGAVPGEIVGGVWKEIRGPRGRGPWWVSGANPKLMLIFPLFSFFETFMGQLPRSHCASPDMYDKSQDNNSSTVPIKVDWSERSQYSSSHHRASKTYNLCMRVEETVACNCA